MIRSGLTLLQGITICALDSMFIMNRVEDNISDDSRVALEFNELS